MTSFDILCTVLGFALGALGLWLLRQPAGTATAATLAALRDELHAERVRAASAHERAAAERDSFERERAAAASDRARLEDAFRSIGGDVLAANSQRIAEVARGVLAEQQAVARGDLDARALAVGRIVEPVAQTLAKLDEHVRGLEAARSGAYEELRTRVEALAAGGSALGEKTAELSRTTAALMQALRSSGARGRWGEIQLKRIVEVAGMLAHCDFEEQQTIVAAGGVERPDLRVLLPGGRFVIVDAKAPLAAYLEAIEALDDATRGLKLKGHGRAMRAHVETLAKREYGRHDTRSPDLKIMFVPSEGALAAALSDDPAIIEDATALGICIASPTTLIAMLRMMSMGWRQEQIEENARRIAELGSELYERIGRVGSLVNKLGTSLGTTVGAYNELVGSVEHRLLVAARRFRELGVVPAAEDLPALKDVDRSVKPARAAEFVALQTGDAA